MLLLRTGETGERRKETSSEPHRRPRGQRASGLSPRRGCTEPSGPVGQGEPSGPRLRSAVVGPVRHRGAGRGKRLDPPAARRISLPELRPPPLRSVVPPSHTKPPVPPPGVSCCPEGRRPTAQAG